MRILVRLFNMMKPYWKTLVVSAVLLIFRAGLELVPPIFQRQIVDGIIGSRDLGRLSALIAGLVSVYALQQLNNAGDMYIRHALGQRIIFDLRVKLYGYLQRLSLSFFERTSTGELMSRVTNDVNVLENFVTHGTALTAVDLLRLVGGAAILMVMDWRLALLVLIPVPLLAGALRIFNSRIRPIYRRVRARLGDINAQLQDSLSGIQVIQAFRQEERELARFSAESEEYYLARVQGIRAWTSSSQHALSQLNGHGCGSGSRRGHGRTRQPVAGHAGRVSRLCHLFLRAHQPPSRDRQHLAGSNRRRGTHL